MRKCRNGQVLELFRHSETITSRDVERLFTIAQRTARHLKRQWVNAGFVRIAEPAKKSRKYTLAEEFRVLH